MTVSERRSMTRGSEGAAGAGLDGGELDTENIHKTALQWGWVHYVMVSKYLWKLFGLATEIYALNKWLGGHFV